MPRPSRFDNSPLVQQRLAFLEAQAVEAKAKKRSYKRKDKSLYAPHKPRQYGKGRFWEGEPPREQAPFALHIAYALDMSRTAFREKFKLDEAQADGMFDRGKRGLNRAPVETVEFWDDLATYLDERIAAMLALRDKINLKAEADMRRKAKMRERFTER